MYFNIAINNIKKSFKDYTIYFITLTLAVCIFYNFNSLNSQTIAQDINKIEMLSKGISYISIFISIVFGGLVIYANNALLKKRKKEFGIYKTLGMAKSKVSKILIYETFIVGIISLIVGLIFGILLSQGISVIVAKLFEFNMDEYGFAISIPTIIKTLIYFGAMFILVMVFNTVVVSKHKLIDMLNASKKNEEIKTRNSIVSIIIFILSIAVLANAYHLGWKYAPTPKNINFPLAILWTAFGTLIFFFGLGSFILSILKKNHGVYLKSLNLFVIKQFSSKINTNFISMTIICIMLSISIFMSSASLSIKSKLEENLQNITSFDATIDLTIRDDNQEIKDIEKALKAANFELKNSYKYAPIDVYNSGNKLSSLFMKYANDNFKNKLKNYDGDLRTISMSQYNNMRKAKGGEVVDLKENEVLLITKDNDEKESISNLVNNKSSLTINGKEYSMKRDIDLKDVEYSITAIVPDSAIENMSKFSSSIYLNGTNEVTKKGLEKQVEELQQKFNDPSHNYDSIMKQYGFILSPETRTQVYNQTKISAGSTLYIGIYLGLIFLVASAAVLAIQQLTEASDSANRYKSLKKIGASDNMINKAIFNQILIHFTAPLALALVHSIMGLIIIGRLSQHVGMTQFFNLGATITMTVIVVIAIYGSYLYAAYVGYKNIVKNA